MTIQASDFKYSDVQKKIKFERSKAEDKARRHYPIVQSRGVKFSALKGNESLTDGAEIEFSGKKELVELINDYLEKGATEIYIQGGFDGAESVKAMADYERDTWIEDWGFLIYKGGELRNLTDY